jgi:hypothetical protein
MLRLALRGNAAFSATSGLISLLAAKPLAIWLGVPGTGLLMGLGAQLLVFATFLVWLSARTQIHPGIALGVIAADVVWVAGTIAVVASGTLTTPGVWVVLGIADVVAVFAIVQGLGLRRMRRAIAA